MAGLVERMKFTKTLVDNIAKLKIQNLECTKKRETKFLTAGIHTMLKEEPEHNDHTANGKVNRTNKPATNSKSE